MVLKLLPEVSMVTAPLPGAVQAHHTEAPPMLLPILGSPDSRVAPTLLPVVVTTAPVSGRALAKLSLTGWAVASSRSSHDKAATLIMRISIFSINTLLAIKTPY